MQSDAIIRTEVFKMDAKSFLALFVFKYAYLWLISLSFIGVVGIIMGIVIDIRWFILGLMLILVVLPMLASFLYYHYALRRECFVNTVNHFVEFYDNEIRITLIFDDEKTRQEIFTYDELSDFEFGNKTIIIPFKKSRKGFLWIPQRAFQSEEEYLQTIQMLEFNQNNYLANANS